MIELNNHKIMTTLTIQVNDFVQENLQKASEQRGVPVKFLLTELLEVYNEVLEQQNLITDIENDDEFTTLSEKLTEVAENKINIKTLPSLEEQLNDV